MKVMKAMKKLKFWSRKKKKRKNLFLDQPLPPPPPPPPYYCNHHYYTPVQPSAPPLPPWMMDNRQPHEAVITQEANPVSGMGSSFCDLSAAAHDSAPVISPSCSAASASTSYQQYMVPNPVYGVPIVPEARTESGAGAFGCVINVGVHLIRCFFPCFHIHKVK